MNWLLLIGGLVLVGFVIWVNVWYFTLMWNSIQGTVVGIAKPVILVVLYVLLGWWTSLIGLVIGGAAMFAGIVD